MALADLSFKLYTDSGLTTPYSGTTPVSNKTDLSDNPQTFNFYFGSPLTTNRSLSASSNPGVDNIVLTPTLVMPVWVLSTAYTVGKIVTPTTPNGKVYRCTVAGTSSAIEPTWPTSSLGSTVTDGGVTWEYYALAHPVTEIKIAATEAGLATATAGASLSIGTSVINGSANAKQVWVSITNTVITPSNNTAAPELAIVPNALIERSF